MSLQNQALLPRRQLCHFKRKMECQQSDRLDKDVLQRVRYVEHNVQVRYCERLAENTCRARQQAPVLEHTRPKSVCVLFWLPIMPKIFTLLEVNGNSTKFDESVTNSNITPLYQSLIIIGLIKNGQYAHIKSENRNLA